MFKTGDKVEYAGQPGTIKVNTVDSYRKWEGRINLENETVVYVKLAK